MATPRKKREDSSRWKLLTVMVSWKEALSFFIWGMGALGFGLLILFVVDIIRFYIFQKGIILWEREIFIPVLALILIGINYYLNRGKPKDAAGS